MLSRIRSVARRIRSLFGRDRLDERLRAEMELHARLLAERHERHGMAPDEARRQARLALGSVARAREECRDRIGFRRLEETCLMTTPDHDRGLLPALGALILVVTALTASAPSPAFAGGAADWPALKPGEATVWYLGHCGYAVKTRSKLLVFDYTGDFKPQVQPPAQRALANGWINPEEIKDLDVIVFASHDHADHYDPVIRGWEKAVKTIHYVFGWDAGAAPHVHSLAGPRGTAAFDGIEIFTVNDHHDTVPEVAFLVRVDGVTIYFNGDYYGKMGRDLPSTTVNDMRYLTSKSQTVDLAFILASASDTYNTIIRSLAPKTVFPMHAPANGESMYATYASDLRKAGIDTPVVVPDKPGRRFDVRNGKVLGGSPQVSLREGRTP